MQQDEMVRLSLECARLAVHGEDFAHLLADGVHRILRADAGVGVTIIPLPADRSRSVEVVVAGAAPVPVERTSQALLRVDQHPTLKRPNWVQEGTHRLSDYVFLPAFWETEVWFYFHGHANGKYAAAAPLIQGSRSTIFVGVHRSAGDFDAADMEALDAVRGPLGPALAFRQAWDEATTRLQNAVGPVDDTAQLTPREAQVLALVARGWTNRHIGHILGITERTVRGHLENVHAKLGVSSRTAAVASWAARTALNPMRRDSAISTAQS
jgi:DNA-binding CsgD family transcriptional regulator